MDIMKYSFLRVYVGQCPLNRVRVRRKWGYGSNAMELRIAYLKVCRLVMINIGKVSIVKNRIILDHSIYDLSDT